MSDETVEGSVASIRGKSNKRLARCCALGAAMIALSGCSSLASDRTTVPMVTDSSTPAVGFTPAPKTSSSAPESEAPELHMQEIPNETLILGNLHVFTFNTGGDAPGYCTLFADAFTCSGAPEHADGATNYVSVAPEGIEYISAEPPERSEEALALNPGEFTEVNAVRCSMIDASKLICSGPGGTVSINGPEQIVREETGN